MADASIPASTYNAWRSTTLGSITERVELGVVFGLLNESQLRGKRVLDVGTGDGTYAIEAAQRGALVTGLDIAPDMLEAAQARAQAHGVSVSMKQGAAEHLPFERESFDVVLAITVLCMVADPKAAMLEMARVLAPGGWLVLGELHRFSAWAVERRVRGWLGSSFWRNARFWSRAELGDLVRSAGLRVVDARGAVFFPPSGSLARLVEPVEPWLTRVNAPGAAFLALSAQKVEEP